MNEKYKRLLKDSAVFALGSLGSKLILFFLVPLYTNVLSTAEYGLADLVTVFVTLLVPIFSLSVDKAVIRFGLKSELSRQQVLCSACFILLCVCLASFCILPVIGLYKSLAPWRFHLCAMVALSAVAETERAYLKVKGQTRAFAIIGIGQTAVLALTNLLLLTVWKTGVRGYLNANIVSLIFCDAACFFVGRIYRDLRRPRIDWHLLGQMLRFSAPLVFSGISWWILHSSDKLMIEWMLGAASLGLYTAAAKIPSLIHVILSIFNQAWGLSSIREMENDRDLSFITSVFERFSFVVFGAGLLFIAVVKPLMNVYVGQDFRPAWVYTPFLLFAAVFYSVYCFIGSLYAAIQHTDSDMRLSVLCAVMNIVINYFGIRAFGIGGAVIGTCVSYCAVSAVSIGVLKRYMRFDICIWRYVVHSALLLIAAGAETFTKCHGIISLACLALMLLIDRREVRALLSLSKGLLPRK